MLYIYNKRKESGVVLVIVLMAVSVMSIFAISILSQNMNQNSATQGQVDKIKAQQFAQGAFWKAYSDLGAGVANPSVPSETMDGKVFSSSISKSSRNLSIVVTHP